MNHQFVFCFSGQGSQYYRMGKELYDRNETFHSWMNRLDEIAKQLTHESVLSILYNENARIGDRFDHTLNTHPAIFMFEYSLYNVLIENGIYPDCLLGASLGEYVSAVISGIMDYEDIMKILVKQAELIEKKCIKAGMMAFLYRLDFFDELKIQYPDIELASINSENHFVISGPDSTLMQIDKIMRDREILSQILPVSHAFHSRFIDPAGDEYLLFLKTFEYKNPRIPYMSCVTGTFLDASDPVEYDYFWDICRKPILIKQAVKNFENDGSYVYIDVGPGGTLANLIKLNLGSLSRSMVIPIITPFGNDVANLTKKVDSIKEL
ncbi:MAG: acyltransferase domain-containing protein [Spirochaetales bacterium]|nr:acyltransferase domain-containing protein [Spirochaetales bacterium]